MVTFESSNFRVGDVGNASSMKFSVTATSNVKITLGWVPLNSDDNAVNNVAVEVLKENETASQHNSPGLPQFQRNEVAVLLFERNRRLFQTD